MAFGEEEEAFDPNGPMDDGNPIGMPEADLTHEVDVSAYVAAKRAAISSHRSQVTDTGSLPLRCPKRCLPPVRSRVVHRARPGAAGCVPAGSSTNDRDLGGGTGCTSSATGGPRPDGTAIADPDLDDLGRAQAVTAADRLELLAAPEPLAVITSPLRRCRRTAAALCERWAVDPVVDVSIAEIPVARRRCHGRAGRLAAGRGARNLGRARRAVHHVSRRRRRRIRRPSTATPWCSHTSSPSTPSSVRATATTDS